MLALLGGKPFSSFSEAASPAATAERARMERLREAESHARAGPAAAVQRGPAGGSSLEPAPEELLSPPQREQAAPPSWGDLDEEIAYFSSVQFASDDEGGPASASVVPDPEPSGLARPPLSRQSSTSSMSATEMDLGAIDGDVNDGIGEAESAIAVPETLRRVLNATSGANGVTLLRLENGVSLALAAADAHALSALRGDLDVLLFDQLRFGLHEPSPSNEINALVRAVAKLCELCDLDASQHAPTPAAIPEESLRGRGGLDEGPGGGRGHSSPQGAQGRGGDQKSAPVIPLLQRSASDPSNKKSSTNPSSADNKKFARAEAERWVPTTLATQNRPGDNSTVNTGRQGHVAGTPGDWECAACHHLNYSFRKACQKCKAGRSSPGFPSPQNQKDVDISDTAIARSGQNQTGRQGPGGRGGRGHHGGGHHSSGSSGGNDASVTAPKDPHEHARGYNQRAADGVSYARHERWAAIKGPEARPETKSTSKTFGHESAVGGVVQDDDECQPAQATADTKSRRQRRKAKQAALAGNAQQRPIPRP